MTGSIIGGLVMAVLNNGLQLLGVGSDRVQIIKGMVLLLAVGIDVWNKSQGHPSITGFLMHDRKKGAPAPAEIADEVPPGGTPNTPSPLVTTPK